MKLRLCLFWCVVLGLPVASHAETFSEPKVVELRLGGTEEAFAYNSLVLTEALQAAGYQVAITYVENVPMSRMEVMLERGEVSAHILGETATRSARYLPVRVGMTDNLVGQRVLFIKSGDQPRFNDVHSLAELRERNLVAGLGEAWRDVAIWQANTLPLYTLSGDWKYLYGMVASGRRSVDYLPRGAHEMALEWKQFPGLDVEENLVFVYEKDHILYVTPTDEALHALLQDVLQEAEASGLIRRLAREFFQAAYEPPVNLDQRRVLRLKPD
ncbi:hypothetical protein NFC81_03010 [Salinispirillum sp. LH 10-3-1]|uniref:Transporter substrate-binding domain-containing protein n=1 Tax=Salinispirillum sp. LH 10-3-1 TaxID=2952525 RepID=A0AB38YHC1_9GAMM